MHHERLDGSGYPNGLKASEINTEAKILAVADIIEAMLSPRPWRDSLSMQDLSQELLENRGMKYDPEVTDTAIRIISRPDFHFDL